MNTTKYEYRERNGNSKIAIIYENTYSKLTVQNIKIINFQLKNINSEFLKKN